MTKFVSPFKKGKKNYRGEINQLKRGKNKSWRRGENAERKQKLRKWSNIVEKYENDEEEFKEGWMEMKEMLKRF